MYVFVQKAVGSFNPFPSYTYVSGFATSRLRLTLPHGLPTLRHIFDLIDQLTISLHLHHLIPQFSFLPVCVTRSYKSSMM